MTGGFHLSLHAANANSQRTVFTINMPPSFLLWWIILPFYLSTYKYNHGFPVHNYGKHRMKTVYEMHSLSSFVGRINEALTPDIHRAHWVHRRHTRLYIFYTKHTYNFFNFFFIHFRVFISSISGNNQCFLNSFNVMKSKGIAVSIRPRNIIWRAFSYIIGGLEFVIVKEFGWKLTQLFML